jgi:hypothetical protein
MMHRSTNIKFHALYIPPVKARHLQENNQQTQIRSEMLSGPSNLRYITTALFSRLILKAMFQNAAAHTHLCFLGYECYSLATRYSSNKHSCRVFQAESPMLWENVY